MTDLTAIDILIDPDKTMLERARAENARLGTGSPNRTSGLILSYSLCSSQTHRS
jgi:hypothetical protein